MDDTKIFDQEKKNNIKKAGKDLSLKKLALNFLNKSVKYNYSYNFTWLGRPIIQYPQDIVAIQELIWNIKPDAIIETGIARGGSLILSASILELINKKGKVLGIDIDIRKHNKKAINEHPLRKRIEMIEGSSIDPNVIKKVKSFIKGKKKILVFLDSNHTYKHVFEELKLYSPLVSIDSYIVVFDTVVDYLNKSHLISKAWSKGNSPKTAVDEFLKIHKNFEIDKSIENKLLITVAPSGYLKRIY